MAKANTFYAGLSSSGVDIQVARRIDGVWFSREKGYNGYGVSWGKWVKIDEPTINADDCLEWGFANFSRFPNEGFIRLPN